jgi:hypothetical protein
MKVFVSWSGEKSKIVANALQDWLSTIIQALRPWSSIDDLSAGSRWSEEIAQQLNDCEGGILCLERANLESTWITFEAGALSRTVGRTLVISYLLDIRSADVKGSLTTFNMCQSDKEGTLKLLVALNNAMGPGAWPAENFRPFLARSRAAGGRSEE